MQNSAQLIDSKYDISELVIKPQFILDWYHDDDAYSDGDVEEVIIDHIIHNEPEDYSKVIYEHFTWPTYYHLTHLRKNLLNWYPFKKEDSILEIGCGLGAITNMLCEKCGFVTAVELSKRRATAALLRCRERENLRVIVGNLNDIEFQEQFDYITLIGVLEYQGTYTNSENPYMDFLVKVQKLLKPGGKLLIAIENQYGAKYWCGAKEDHTGLPFDGINQYQIGNKNARTFSRMELKELIQGSGFDHTYFYYPMPDYKLPTVVYSEEYLPKDANMQNMAPAYVPDNSTLVIQEKRLYDDLIKNHVFEFFANSFLVECSPEKDERAKAVFAALSSQRVPDYRIGTVITSDKKVIKLPLENRIGIRNHLKQTLGNSQALSSRGIKNVPGMLREDGLYIHYMEEPSLEELIIAKYRAKDTEKILEYYLGWISQIEQSSVKLEDKENIIYELGIDTYSEEKDYGTILQIGYLDMIPRNCFIRGEEYHWYDQEWKLDKIPSKYIMYRGLNELYRVNDWMNKLLPYGEMIRIFKILPYLKQFDELSKMFNGTVMDGHHLPCARVFDGCGNEELKGHIGKLLKE